MPHLKSVPGLEQLRWVRPRTDDPKRPRLWIDIRLKTKNDQMKNHRGEARAERTSQIERANKANRAGARPKISPVLTIWASPSVCPKKDGRRIIDE
jgi:hypothetical protein